MSNFTSGSYPIQVAMLRLCAGLVFIAIIFASHVTYAAQPIEGVIAPELDLLTIKIAHYPDVGTSLYHFNENVRTRGSMYSVTTESAFSSNLNLPVFAKFKINNIWITSIRWHLVSSNERASLAPVFRVESDDSRLEIRPIQHSARMVWSKALP